VVGFALFGAVTFLPVFLQVAKGVDPTTSGLQLLPLMGGLLFTSILSGILISRWGRYKVFPVVGTAVMTLGLYLLSTVGAATSDALMALYMVIMGLGLGGVMQVLVIAVQNAVAHRDLGVATAGATFFRSIGGSFGAAIFGAIFANVLGSRLAANLRGLPIPKGLSASLSPAELAKLPPAVIHGIKAAYASSIDTVFVVAVPIGAVAFLLTFLLPEIELRTSRHGGGGAGDGAAPQGSGEGGNGNGEDAVGVPSDGVAAAQPVAPAPVATFSIADEGMSPPAPDAR
jgi:MFS family permease